MLTFYCVCLDTHYGLPQSNTIILFMNRHDAILALIASIYQSALNPADWIVTLETLAKLFGGHAAFTMTVGAGAHESPGLTCYNLPIEAFVAYGDYYYQHDLWSPPWLSQGLNTLGSVYSGDQLVDDATLKRSVWFNEFLQPLDIGHSMFAALSNDLPSPSILVIDRPLGSAPFSKADRDCMASLVSHFTRALAISSQLQILKAGIDAHETAVNTLKVGIISITQNAKVLYANDLALSMLSKPGGLMIRQGLLSSVTAQGNQELALLLDLAKRGMGQTWTLARQPPNPPLTIKSLPLGMAETTTRMPKEMQTGKILLLLAEENSHLSNPYDHFGKLYRLTRQEIKVLQGLVAGYSTKEIADRHYVSYHTVRSQLASLLQKTGCHQQKDLLRLFFSGQKSDCSLEVRGDNHNH